MLLFHTSWWQRACIRGMMQTLNLNAMPGIMGIATQELRAGMPGSLLRTSKEECFKNDHLDHVCAFQKLRKHHVSCLLKIVVKISMTYYLKKLPASFLKWSMHSLPYITHQATSGRKLYFKSSRHKNRSIFPIENGDLCFMWEILTTKHLLYFTYTNMKKMV